MYTCLQTLFFRFTSWQITSYNDTFFVSSVLPGQEGFNRENIVSFYNNHLQAEENPNGIAQSTYH